MNAYSQLLLEHLRSLKCPQWHEGDELNPDNKPIVQKTKFTNPEQPVDKSVDDVEKEKED